LPVARLSKKLRKLMKVLACGEYRSALRKAGVAAAIEHERLLKSLNCNTVIDIGANRGQFALVSRRCFPQARIISFEPLAAPAARFRAVFGGDSRVDLRPVAIGPESRDAEIHVAAEDDSSSLLPMTDLQRSLFAGTAEVRTERIRVEPLATQITREDLARPALLKIDVQGYELLTLRGCESLLESIDYVYVECSFVELYAGQALAHEVIAYLYEQSLQLDGVYNIHYDSNGRAVQADMLFTPIVHAHTGKA
jgi:FkbM family methyltransferase